MQSNSKHNLVNIEQAAGFPILNAKVIQSIFDLGDREFAENLISQYLKKAKDICHQIQEFIKKKKTSEIYALANELRDSSLYIGTERVVVISTFIYKHAKKRNIPPLKNAGILLAEVLKESEKALNLIIKERSETKVGK
ncbi:hypothetical protein HZR84_03870 [Hyphobacterium sp. CCMP332]|nr:hypothetical protein HZR84_03870 [Hyphobacterium sp. CCMP332]